MELPIYKIVVNEDDDTGVEFVSLVDRPAIQKDFLKFNEFESYSDYPEAAKENAKTALRWAEENGWGSCGTDVGKQRANQLANGEAISRETIARMAAFERHRQNSDKELGDGCGRLMWLAWGGDEGISWAQRKLAQIDKQKFAIQSEEKRIITGPAMIADLPIYRFDADRGEYYVVFDADTIWTIAKKIARNGKYNAVNTDHAEPVDNGVYMIEMYFVNRDRGIMPPVGFEEVADGSMFVSYLVDNDEIWQKVKAGDWKGFSVEGIFDMEYEGEVAAEMRRLSDTIKEFLHTLK